MALLDDLADELARDVLAALDDLGDDRFYEKVAKSVGELSPTLQEAFMTSIRLRLAERRGRRTLETALAKLRAGSA
ncbi:hypothetical protein [Frigidibacter mobilis]|uniref:Uncharacterized protein n=1 Tax=Frigidibacter mobilis TaxID=1335048 RepID=A0A159Z181_9RHOB|nr:hypothetical protein [Frigidibacter mobilis]AMY68661.1 hypothetical protein AKL17_1406 [Frigidibacter mobilis]